MRKLVKKGTALTSAVLMLVGSMPVTAVNVLASESIGNQIAVQAEQSLSVQADGQTESGIWGTCEWTYEDGVLTIGGGVGESGITWWNYRNDIKKIIINGRITFPEGTSLNSLFYKMNVLETIEGLDNLDTSGVTDMSNMFYYCSLLESIDVSKFNTSSVTDMSWMFDGCSSLENIDVSKFNTSNVTNMSCMFSGCSSLESIDVSKFNTSSVMRMYGMFMGCSSLKSIDVSKFNTSKVTDMPCMFDGCSSLKSIDVSKFNTSKVTDMSWMFDGCSSLKNIDVSNFNTFNVTNMSYMFQNCSSLQNLDLSGFNMNCGSFDEMFDNDNLLSIKMPAEFGKNKERFLDALVLGMPEGKWTDDTTGISYNNIASMELLEGHSYKFNPEKMNVDFTTRYNTRGIILKAIEDCESLETVNLGNMTNLRDIQDMFKNCIKLRKIDLSKVNFSNVYYTNNMLKGCDITEITLPSGFGRKQDTLVNQIRNVMRNGQWKDHTDNKIYQDIPETLYAGHTYVYVKPSGELDLDVDYYVESGEQGGNFVIGKASGGDGDYQYKLIWYDTYEKQLHEGVYTDNRIIEYVYAGWGKYNDRYWNDKARYENIKCDTSDIILYMEVKDGTGKTVRKRVTQVNNWGYEKGLKFDVSVSKPKGSGAFYESRFSTHLRITCNLKGSAGGQMFYKVVVYNRDTKQWGIVKDYTLLDLNVNAKDLNHAYFDTYWPMSVGNRDFYVDILDTSDGTVTRSYGVNYAIGEPDSGAQLMTDKTVAKTGEKVTLTARTDKGDNCQYKYIIYNTSTKQWYMLRDYSSDSTFVWTAGSAGERNIYVDVKDSNGNVTRSNTGKVIVRDASALDIEVSTSCTTASVGDTVKIKAQGKGGVPGYTYCLHYINTASNYYSSECDFTSDNEFEYRLPSNSAGGSMRFWVEVKDAQGSQYCSEIMEVNVSK